MLTLLLTGSVFAGLADIVKFSFVKGGVIVHLGCGEGKDIAELLVSDSFVIQGLDTSDTNIAEARQNIRKAGVYGKVTAIHFDGTSLPYVDNLVNLIISDGSSTLLQLVSTKDGKTISEYKLETNPIFDGISVANEKVFISLKNGKVQCWSN